MVHMTSRKKMLSRKIGLLHRGSGSRAASCTNVRGSFILRYQCPQMRCLSGLHGLILTMPFPTSQTTYDLPSPTHVRTCSPSGKEFNEKSGYDAAG